MSNSISGISSKTLTRAAAIKARIEKLTSEIDRLVGGSGIGATSKAKAASTSEPKPKRKMSKAARARIAEGARKRWAKVKAAGKNAL